MRARYWLAAAFVAVGCSAMAGDDVVQLGRFQPPAGGFAGVVQTAAAKETNDDDGEDTVLTHGRYRRGYSYGGFRGGYGYGYGYRSSFSYYPRYSYGYYSRGYSFYRPYYASYYRPYYGSYYGSGYGSYAVATYQPTYYVSSWPTATYAVASSSYATAQSPSPTVVNNYYYSTPAPNTTPRPMIPPSDTAPKYDGGPANPVPQPMADPVKPVAPQDSSNVKISTGKTKVTKYPAYGEK